MLRLSRTEDEREEVSDWALTCRNRLLSQMRRNLTEKKKQSIRLRVLAGLRIGSRTTTSFSAALVERAVWVKCETGESGSIGEKERWKNEVHARIRRNEKTDREDWTRTR